MKKLRHGTITITLSIPTELKAFFDELSENGYNRSFLMRKMTTMLQLLYNRRNSYPGGIHSALNQLIKEVRTGTSPTPAINQEPCGIVK